MLLTGDDTGSGSLTGRLHAVARRSAHLTALCALAFAQPLFDILGKNPAFFAVRGTRSASGSTLGGWAANVKTRKPADAIAVFVDGKSVFVGEPGKHPAQGHP